MPLPPYLMSNFPSVRPSLNLQFDSQPTPEDMTSHLASVGATFSRASIGTYTDANGLVAEATAGQARPNYSTAGVHEGLLIEESRTNLVRSSEDFSIDWNASNSSVIINQAIAPDGKVSADKLIANTNNTNHNIGTTSTVSGAICFSVFAKADGYNHIRLRFNLSSVQGRVWFNLSNGTVGTSDAGVDGFIEDVGNGWYRCIAVESGNTNTSVGVQIFPQSANNQTTFAGDGESGILIWGAQFEEGLFATSYIPTIPTFTDRGSVATFLGSDGLIQTASVDVARSDTYVYVDDVLTEAGLLLEGSAENLVTSSEDFSLPYVADPDLEPFRVTIERNNIIAPDGKASADRIVETSDTGAHAFQVDALSNQKYTLSIFAKAGERDHIALALLLNGTNVQGVFDLTNGTVTAFSGFTIPDSLGIEDYGNGWYRCYIVSNDNNTRASFSIAKDDGTTSYAGDTTKGLYVWGAQIEAGSQPTSYFPTEHSFTSRASTATFFNASGVLSTASTNVARTDHKYIGGQWLEAGLLLEGASTNLVTNSENFSGWTDSNVTVTSNDATAPDGTTTATKLTDDATNGQHRVVKSFTTSSSGEATYSIFLKRGTLGTVVLNMFSGGTIANADVNLANGTIEKNSGISATIENVDNDWYRCSITGNLATTSTFLYVYMQKTNSISYIGSGDTVFIWGAQLEEQSQSTSYIATSGSEETRSADVSSAKSSLDRTRDADSYTTATKVRSADVCYIDGTAFTDFYNDDAGTVFSHAKLPSKIDIVNQGIFTFELSSDNDTFLTNYSIGTGELRLLVKDLSGTIVSNITQSSAPSPNDIVKIASKYGSSYGLFIDGLDIGSDSITHTLSFNKLLIGKLTDDYFNGSIKKLIYFPRALSDNELTKLTQ